MRYSFFRTPLPLVGRGWRQGFEGVARLEFRDVLLDGRLIASRPSGDHEMIDLDVAGVGATLA